MNAHPSQILQGLTINVHNHGFVRLVDYMGTDQCIVEAARVSYHSGSKGEEQDKKLLRYLFVNKHTSPFEMAKIKFNIKMPIFVQRQFIRHRMQNFNEVSARYTELSGEFFLPEAWRTNDGVKNKQVSQPTVWEKELHQEWNREIDEFYGKSYELYQRMLGAGIARELARMVLPVAIYTEFYSCWDLNNLLKYFFLRDDPHAQGEHQDYARAMKEITKQLFPWTMEIYEETLAKKNAAKT